MSHLSELTSAQQAVLDSQVVEPIYFRLTIHGDDGNITLEDDIIQVDNIRFSKRIDLDENMEQFTAGEVSVDLVNWQQEYDARVSGNIFDLFRSPTLSAVALGGVSVKISKLTSPPLGLASWNDLAGKAFTISDGKASFSDTVLSVQTVDSGTRYQINFTNACNLQYNFPVGSLIEINQLIGRLATLTYVLGDSGETLTAGKYVIIKAPDLSIGQATLVMQDAFNKLLSNNLPANMASVKEYQYTDDSTATLIIDDTNVRWSGAKIGQWELEITEIVAGFPTIQKFTLTYPDGSTKNGQSNQNFFSDPQGYRDYSSIEIRTPDWNGLFDVGDKVIIETYYQQPSSDDHLVDGLNNILAGCLSSDLYDSSGSNRLLGTYKPIMSSLSPVGLIKREISCMQVAALFCQHLNLTMFVDTDGKLNFTLLQPIYNSSLYEVDDPIDVDIEFREPVNAVRVLYNYSYTSLEYRSSYVYPENTQGNAVELKLPFFTTESQAKAQAQRYWLIWQKGVRILRFIEKLNKGIAFSLSDQLLLSSTAPPLSQVETLIFDIVKNPQRMEVELKAIDTSALWEDVGFYDVDNYDEGKVYF